MSIKKIYIKVKREIINIKDTKIIFENHKKYLSKGKYMYTIGVKQLFLNKNIANKEYTYFSRDVSTQSWKFKAIVAIRKLCRKLCFKFKVDNTNPYQFNGDILMLDRVNDVKVFNTNKNLMLSIIQDKERYEMTRNNYLEIQKQYKTPFIKAIDENQIIVEKFIKFKRNTDWNIHDKEKFFLFFFNNLENNINIELSNKTVSFYSTSKLYNEFIEEVSDREFISIIKNMISLSAPHTKWPRIKCHGDTKFDNILLEKNNFYIIDWEFYGDYIFYYDFMNLIINEALDEDNYVYLNRFLNDDFDDILRKLFNAVGITYKADKKKCYIVLYLMERVTKVDSKLYTDIDDLNFVYSRYKEILQKL